MQRYCFALDLKDDPALIDEYLEHHRHVWPEVLASFREAGIDSVQLYRLGTRLVMLFEANDAFSFERKALIDAQPRIQAWEELMAKYQQPLPWAAAGQKWAPMECIFDYAERSPDDVSALR